MLIFKKYYDNFFEARLEVEESQHEIRLDQFVSEYLKSHSREQIKKKIKSKECKVINRTCSNKSSSKLKHKDIVQIVIHRTSHEDEYWRGDLLSLEAPKTVFEDDDLLVISKPPFMSTHPTGKHLFNCATVYYENMLGLKTIHSIHRLDRETSGVLLLGKNPNCANLLTTEFENTQVRKCYLWISKKGSNSKSNFFSAKERLHAPYDGLKRVIVETRAEDSNEGKHAETKFHVISENAQFALGLAFPKTGRTHQIRVHAKEHGHPLIGDKLYLGGYSLFQRFKDNQYDNNDCDLVIAPRHFLHAFGLKIKYQKSFKTFYADLPKDMLHFVETNFDEASGEILQRAQDISDEYFSQELI